MAFSIADLLSYFSQAADGQRTAPDTPSAGILNQVGAGAGRGVVNPPMVNPNAPRPQAPLSPLPSVEVASRPVASVLAEEPAAPPIAAAMNPTDQRLAAGTQQAPMSPEPQSPGILSQIGDVYGKLRDSGVLNRLGNGLISAGSQDPGKMIALLQQGDVEAAKMRDARKKANQPKMDHISGTPFFQVTYPDGRIETVNNPALAQFYEANKDRAQSDKIEKAVLDDRLARGRDAEKTDRKAGEEAKPLLNDIQGLKGRWQQAQQIVGGQGTMAQIQGIPGIAGIAGFFGGDEVAKNKFLEGLTVDETLLNTARTKGAISNQEMMLFKSPIPSVTDDREKVWKPWIEQRLGVLDKLEKYYAGEASRSGGAGGSAAAPQASPPPSDQLRAAVTAAGIPFEPDKFQYRIGPNGQVQRKAK